MIINKNINHNNIKPNALAFGRLNKVHTFNQTSDTEAKKLDKTTEKLVGLSKENVQVIPGFVLSECTPENLDNKDMNRIDSLISNIEKEVPHKFGNPENPMVLSLKTKDKSIHVGFNTKIAEGLVNHIGCDDERERFVFDTFGRVIRYYGTQVYDIKPEKFDKKLGDILQKHQRSSYNELPVSAIRKELVPAYKHVFKENAGREFPEDIRDQLKLAINKLQKEGDIISLQFNPFNHIGKNTGTAVCFSRDPETGEQKPGNSKTGAKEYKGGYVRLANGNTLTAGIGSLERPLSFTKKVFSNDSYEQMVNATAKSEKTFKNPQSVHFVVYNNKVLVSDSKDLKQLAGAKFKSYTDMAKEGIITEKEALSKVEVKDLEEAIGTRLNPEEKSKALQNGQLLGKGTGISANSGVGKVIFDSQKAAELSEKGEKVILVKGGTTNADDVNAILSSSGIIAANVGPSSHAAVVAKGVGKPCIVDVKNIKVNEREGWLKLGDKTVREGDSLSIDGKTGEIFDGELALIKTEPSKEILEMLSFADKNSKLKVLANAETPEDAKIAVKYGAKGIGLGRTEHMFFKKDRIPLVQKVILEPQGSKERTDALKKLEEMQYQDFCKIFKEMKGKPITIRLLDMPLDEFLPKSKDLIKETTKNPDAKKQALLEKVESLEETNPMLGNRGSRQGITDPEIYNMQVRAISKAAIDTNTKPKIMLPLISNPEEFKYLANSLKKQIPHGLNLEIGSMIEVPGAALSAGEMAKDADFFSFGTNDLTQTTLGISRNDGNKFLSAYQDKGILKQNPFDVIHPSVKRLMNIAVTESKQIKPDMQIGVCGEQAANQESIDYLNKSKVNYISCSPQRILSARLAAGKANIAFGSSKKAGGSEDFNVFSKVMEDEFKQALKFTRENASVSSEKLLEEINKDYEPGSVNSLKFEQPTLGYNNVVLIIPGIDKNGKVPEIFPMANKVKKATDGGHWKIQINFLTDLQDKVKQEKPDFSLENMKKGSGLEVVTTDEVNDRPALPAGVTLPTSRRGNKKLIRENEITAGKDSEGKPNYACIHGFMICDGDKTYFLIDAGKGVKEFMKKQKPAFDSLKEKFGITEIIAAKDCPKMVGFKQESVMLQQLMGDASMAGVQVSEITGPPSDSNEFTTAHFIEQLLNPTFKKW